ncbi:autotransporter outer membrane beta-barrel domain-containing protein [Asticcacaulis sp. AC460]|uniref:autotransporter outer membrane beta-barrel domain-containing protein n=1 Tax=Asticcacaulis sp. AC460 TaxID=1282360 RepID=UPI001F2A3987|nr:autotransporter outer membrane beta-barrel domain-containing protein [Asticcacaulis sp. AC460]
MTATALSLTLAALSLAGPTLAATTISTATTAPVNTTTTGDLTVSSTGSITLTSGTAITVNSDNDVTLNGKIDMAKSAAGSTGILIDGGRTSDLIVNANITVTDDYTATDTKNTDTILDGPFADDKTRYGIRSTGTTPFIGNFEFKSGASTATGTPVNIIQVEGSNAYGIRFENNVQGNLTMDGGIKMEGDNNTAVSLENGVTGTTYLSGVIATHGTGSSAVKLAGEFDGSVIIDGSYTGYGYATIDALANDALKKVLATPEDMGQSGVLVDIRGNVDKGILIGSTVSDSSTSSTDEDGNGIPDDTQTTASLTSYGGQPALRIASDSQDLTIGGLVYNASAVSPPTVNYALSIRGTINGSGLYRNVNATGVQLGGLGHAVNLANGIQVKGQVLGNAVGGIATGLLVGSGATTPRLDIDGKVQATAIRSLLTTTSGTTTTYDIVAGEARAIDIAAGATLPVINVKTSGGILAVSAGTQNKAVAIRDSSNSLINITNNGLISASLTSADDNGDSVNEALVNRAIAIDTRTNSAGLTLTQVDTNPGDTKADTDIPAPAILGDILLGSGNDAISSSGGNIVGNIDYGTGANSFTVTNKATYFGKMTNGTGGTVALNITDGAVALLGGTHLNTTTVNVGATSTLSLVVDTATPTTPMLVGTGAVTFATGAKMNLAPTKLFTDPKTFTLLTGSSIDLGGLTPTVSYLYTANLSKNAGNTELYANMRLKTQSEAAFSDNQYAALVPVLTVIAKDSAAETQVMAQMTKEGFDRVYNQYLPDYSGENILGLSLGSHSLNRSLGSLTLIPGNDAGQYWLQEYGYHTTRDYADTAGFESTGFSFAAGREAEVYGNQTVGFYLSYTSATPTDTFAVSEEEMINSDVTVGGYWRLKTGAFKGWAHAGIGFTNFESLRQNSTLAYTSKAEWSGFSYSGGVGASVDYKLGKFSVTPMVLADYYALSEKEHAESGGGDYFDLSIGKRDSHLLSSTAMLNFSYGRFFLKPELWVGYKQNISAEIADTVAMFKNGAPFTLTGGDLEGGGPIAGFRVSADNEWSYFGIEGDYEKQDTYTNYSIALRTRFQF